MTQVKQFRLDTPLSSTEIRTIIEKGSKFFGLLELNDRAEIYLEDHPDFAEALKKW